MSYNRPIELKRAVLSVIPQRYLEICVFEDKAPKRNQVIEVVQELTRKYPDSCINLILNEDNKGYDGNLRSVFEVAKGDYCLIMGDDDILLPNALESVESALSMENVGFIGRAWKEIDVNTHQMLSFSRYYKEDRFFLKGRDAVIEFFRKSVFITGLVIHREVALKFATNKFDGTLLYQIYLLSRILLEKNGYYISNFVAVRFSGAEHYFGSASAEKDLHTIGETTAKSVLNFMHGFKRIAENLEETDQVNILNEIQLDFSRNAFGFLESQRKFGARHFLQFADKLSDMGYNRSFHFMIYKYLLLAFGSKVTGRLVLLLKRVNALIA